MATEPTHDDLGDASFAGGPHPHRPLGVPEARSTLTAAARAAELAAPLPIPLEELVVNPQRAELLAYLDHQLSLAEQHRELDPLFAAAMTNRASAFVTLSAVLATERNDQKPQLDSLVARAATLRDQLGIKTG